MIASNIGYAGVRITSGTNGEASGNRVNFPVSARTCPSRRYPSWSGHSVFQSGRWYQMKNSPWHAAMSATSASQRRTVMATDCTVSRRELTVQHLDIVDEPVQGESADDRLPAAAADRATLHGILQQTKHAFGERA